MPIRVGIIGLSANPQTWAARTHIAALRKNPLYEVVAFSASSPESAAAAARVHGIPNEKAYSSTEALVNDPDVDLIVVCVKVPEHKAIMIPALQAGKDLMIEWPVAANLAEAEELYKLAKEKGVKTFVGLQTRQVPAVLKAKEIIDSGALGRITSTTMFGSGLSPMNIVPARNAYCGDIKNGTNMVSVPGGHNLDAIAFLLGEFESLSATVHRHFEMKVEDANGEFKPLQATAPDAFALEGTLKSGASASVHITASAASIPSTGSWIIYGEKGALKLEGGYFVFSLGPVKLQQAKEGAWQDVEVALNDPVEEVYQAFAEDKKDGSLVTLEGAIIRHRMLEAIYKSAREGTKESYSTVV